MIYEFECSKGHVTEASVPMGTKTYLCQVCIAEMRALAARDRSTDVPGSWNPTARRILSPTRTTFVFADTHRKRS